MKKLMVLAAVGVAAVFVVAPVVRAGGAHDFAVGGFQGTGGNNVGFSATSDPNGANPHGYLTQNVPQVRKDNFRVTCLAVTGNHAAIGLTPANATTAANFPDGRVLVVIDNGNPQGGQTVDHYGYVASDTNDCTQFTTTDVTNVPVNGNVLVHDEP